MKTSSSFSLIFFTITQIVFAARGMAAEGWLNRLLAPGPLIEGHKQLEGSDCLKCHTAGKGIATTLCLDCHKDLKTQIETQRGFHFQIEKQGKEPGALANECLHCHSDHKGREYDSTIIDEKNFEHKKTGFLLDGKHEKLKCEECHTTLRKKKPTRMGDIQFFGQTASCLSCHQKQSPHEFAPKSKWAQLDCNRCHGTRDWKSELKFNHDQETKFALKGAHTKLSCQGCHKPDKSKPTEYKLQSQCLACHKDFHEFGKSLSQKKKPNQPLVKCELCHQEKSWKEPLSFNHDKSESRFALDGAHVELECKVCHKPKNVNSTYFFQNLESKKCETCHETPHKATFSQKLLQKQCTECHTTQDWFEQKSIAGKPSFDHDTQTRFKLEGKHQKLQCKQCHTHQAESSGGKAKKQVFKFEGFDKQFCYVCHSVQGKTPHANQFSKVIDGLACAQCHNSQSFADIGLVKKKFDHTKTGFALKDSHAKTECEQCHTETSTKFEIKPFHNKRQYLFATLKKDDCATCHRDPHHTTYGTACSQCHQEKGWKFTPEFHRGFTLKGIHTSLQCNECHRDDRRLSGMSEQCYGCHQKDDVHAGQLPACGQCHRQHFWENPEFKHSLSLFPLRGVHRTLECTECHSRGNYRGTPNRCVDCHLSQAIAVTSPPHLIPEMSDCQTCHKNQFQF